MHGHMNVKEKKTSALGPIHVYLLQMVTAHQM